MRRKSAVLQSSTLCWNIIPDTNSFWTGFMPVYIAVPHHLHYEMARRALLRGSMYCARKPLALAREAEELFRLAEEKGVVLLEALKTAFCPAFQQLTSLAGSGIIGSIKAPTL